MLGAGAGSVLLGTVLFGTAWNSESSFAGGASVFFLYCRKYFDPCQRSDLGQFCLKWSESS